ncbi:MAG: sigma 54-interacting transcriptional regulator [Deltaproteobacteria bacterium]|nr:sigma 54-interacting transcriptional regulator [Deltaproteobacteria bacterium]
MDIQPAWLDAARATLANPFVSTPDAADPWRALEGVDAEAVAATLVDNHRADDAEAVLLALGVRQARRHESPSMVLAEESLAHHPSLARLPRPRSAWVRVACAAARCERTLATMHGGSAAMRALKERVWGVSFGASLRHALVLEQVIRDHDVLIVGETGTGKEMVAQALLDALPGPSDGGAAPRNMVNAAALPETLVEGELFGHVRGAYTGANESRAGRIRSADGGGFFLDEVGDLPLSTQSKLLRVLELDEVAPLGSDRTFTVDVRFIAATHRDLADMVRANQFRRDLYERLAGCTIHVPPLRDRPEDIPEIGMHFVREVMNHPSLAPELARVAEWLAGAEARSRAWRGNVRALHNTLRNMMLGLPPEPEPGTTSAQADTTGLPRAIADASAPLSLVEDWYIGTVLAKVAGNQSEAARVLGVNRSTLQRRSQRPRP